MPKKITTYYFIMTCEKIHNNKYDYSKTIYISSSEKCLIICPEHGEFKQVPNNHLNGQGCPICGLAKNTNSKILGFNKFIEKARVVHVDKYDYSLVEYINCKTKVKIICYTHGVFKQRPTHHLQGSGCPICRESKGERIISEYLKINDINFIPQYKFPGCKNKFELPFDFYLPELNMCIEYDGRQHVEVIEVWGGKKILASIKRNDTIKTIYCKDNDIELIRVNNKINNIFQYLNDKFKNKLEQYG